MTDKDLSGRDGAIAGRKTIADMRAKLAVRAERMDVFFHPDDAEDFCITAWHLYHDWISKEKGVEYRLARQKTDKRRLPADMILLLDVLRDLTNGAKHVVLLPEEAAKRVIAKTHSGQTASWYQYFFHESIEGVTSTNGYYFSVRKIRDLTLRYFDWVFDDSIPLKDFPGDLLGDIWLCNPAHRGSSTPPPNGAIIRSTGDAEFVTIPPQNI